MTFKDYSTIDILHNGEIGFDWAEKDGNLVVEVNRNDSIDQDFDFKKEIFRIMHERTILDKQEDQPALMRKDEASSMKEYEESSDSQQN